MSKFGINVPPGVAAFTVDDVTKAAQTMADEAGEVSAAGYEGVTANDNIEWLKTSGDISGL